MVPGLPRFADSEESEDEHFTPISPQRPIRKAKSKAAEILAAPADPTSPGKEDISGSDSVSDFEPEKEHQESEDDSGSQDSQDDRDSQDNDVDVEDMEGLSEDDDDDSNDPPVKSDTEDESDDEEEDRVIRRNNKRELLKEIEEQLAAPTFRSSVYEPDEEDMELIKKYVISPILRSAKKIIRFGSRAPDTVMRMVNSGELPTRGDKTQTGFFSTTCVPYTKNLLNLLGLIQEDMLNEGLEGDLVEGKLRIRQFFAMKGEDFLELPEDIHQYLDKMSSPSKKSFALAGFLHLVESLMLYSTTSAAMRKFRTRNEDEKDLSDLQMRDRARAQKREFREHLREVKENCKSKQKFSKYAGEKNLDTKTRAEFRSQHEGSFLPNPKEAIGAYLSSEGSKKMYRQLEEYSSNKTILKKDQMSQLTRNFLKRLLCKMGIRLQVFGDPFTRQKFWDASEAGGALSPMSELIGGV